MPEAHELLRQVDNLQQCLSSNKRPLGLFIGAGCPMAIRTSDGSPLVPGIAGMTESVRNALASSTECEHPFRLVAANLVEDGKSSPTVEDMLNHIRGLRAVVGAATVRGLSASDLDTLDQGICEHIYQMASKSLPEADTPYHRIAVWADAVERDAPVEIFTTNYDLLMEQALEECNVPYFDGFAGGRRPFFSARATEEDKLPPRWVRLWKLHGSINWYQRSAAGVFRGAAADPQGSRRIIHPSHLKYEESRRMPYLALIDRLRAFLKQPAAAVVLLGYSFRDEHINEVLIQGLQGTQTAVGFALLHGRLQAYPEAVKLSRGRSNLVVLARDGAVISGQTGEWTEQDPSSQSAPPCEWLKVAEEAPDGYAAGRSRVELTLGDCATFSRFLHQMAGSAATPREAI